MLWTLWGRWWYCLVEVVFGLSLAMSCGIGSLCFGHMQVVVLVLLGGRKWPCSLLPVVVFEVKLGFLQCYLRAFRLNYSLRENAR